MEGQQQLKFGIQAVKVVEFTYKHIWGFHQQDMMMQQLRKVHQQEEWFEINY